MQKDDYQLGHAGDEEQRQQIQARLMEPMTRKLLDDCGIAEGQTVLDIGCGPGDVALLAAEKVGPNGRVIGIDIGPKFLDVARQRARKAGYANVWFHEGSEADLGSYPDFDIAVGRLVLIHQKDPTTFVKTVAAKVRPGGVLAFHEHAGTTPPPCQPTAHLYNEVIKTITDCFRLSFDSASAGLQMCEIFHKSGLSSLRMNSAHPVICDPDSEIFDWCALCLKACLALGTLKNNPYNVDTISSELREEFLRLHTQVLGMQEFTGWARVA